MMSNPTKERFALTIREAAQALGVSERTVRRAVAAGKLRVVRIGRCVRVPQDSISALLSTANVRELANYEDGSPDASQARIPAREERHAH